MIATAAQLPAGSSLGVIDLLLRDRPAMLARIRSGADPKPILVAMIGTIAVAMAVVGAAIGSYRGGAQIAYAAVKLPLVLLGTAVLSAPTLTAIGAALGRRARFATDFALVMSALAFGALMLAACTPLILLGQAMGLDYHDMTLLMVVLFGIAGVGALSMVIRGVAAEQAPGGAAAIAALCCVFMLVGAQLAWALRPYLVRPRTEEVPFVRELEDSLFDSIVTTFDSARGIYVREEAP